MGGCGTQTAGLGFGGGPPSTGATEEYNGTSWVAGGSLNTGRHSLAGAGIQTAALAFGGTIPGVTGATEKYDGTSWTTTTSMSNARTYLAGAGTATAALAFGGSPFPGKADATEEFLVGSVAIKTITTT